uniref:Secreted protein n=1 Tax=Echinococcus granulosus TaxID=6210 RepID=A0A068WXS6_ECHGR|nr:hypothetical protein EgrG_000937900 [Echinococcus granulosus]
MWNAYRVTAVLLCFIAFSMFPILIHAHNDFILCPTITNLPYLFTFFPVKT